MLVIEDYTGMDYSIQVRTIEARLIEKSTKRGPSAFENPKQFYQPIY